MNRNTLVIAAAIAVNFAIAAPAHAVSPEDRAREAASEGPQALRSFVQRTRMIYALNIQDFATVRDEATEPSESEPQAANDEELRAEKALAEFREQIDRDSQRQ
jgi:hypothetical protein